MYANELGLRSDGTIWAWAKDSEQPKQFGSDHDWVEVCAGNGYSFGRKQDGTLWGWGNNNQNQLGNGPGPTRPDPVQMGTNHNWKAISTTEMGTLALRADGTIWTWGPLNCVSKGAWISTNYPVPTQFCRESNWVGLSDRFEKRARNQAGESWSFNNPLPSLPSASVPVASIGSLQSSNAATIAIGLIFTTNWNFATYELRTNRTLWATPSDAQPPGAPPRPPLRVGQRSDWVSLWSDRQSMLGMTSDGTLWTWGRDYGQESHWTQVFGERFSFLKAIIGTLFGAPPPSNLGLSIQQYPKQKEPRPLMRLVSTNSAAAGR